MDVKTSAADILQDLRFGEWSQVEKEMLRGGGRKIEKILISHVLC